MNRESERGPGQGSTVIRKKECVDIISTLSYNTGPGESGRIELEEARNGMALG